MHILLLYSIQKFGTAQLSHKQIHNHREMNFTIPTKFPSDVVFAIPAGMGAEFPWTWTVSLANCCRTLWSTTTIIAVINRTNLQRTTILGKTWTWRIICLQKTLTSTYLDLNDNFPNKLGQRVPPRFCSGIEPLGISGTGFLTDWMFILSCDHQCQSTGKTYNTNPNGGLASFFFHPSPDSQWTECCSFHTVSPMLVPKSKWTSERDNVTTSVQTIFTEGHITHRAVIAD